jgi:peptide chain release factor subunit 3
MDQFNWAKTRFDEIKKGLTPFLYATGFKDEDLIWVPIVGINGDNIKDPVEPKVCNWYKGPCLIDALDNI